jgi:hypothetical protein
MKITVLAISLVLLLGSLFLVQRVYALPTEVEQQVTVVEYQHESKFDYVAHLKPSYLFEDYQAPPAMPQIPANFIDGCSMTFTFESAEKVSRDVRIEAVLENAQSWQKTVNLLPETSQTGDFSLGFSLDLEYFKTLAQTIDEEIGIMASSVYNLSIKVTVSQPQAASGQPGQDFTQVFPIKIGKSFVEMSNEFNHRQSDSLGTFGYTIQLKPNTLFEVDALKSPPLTTSDKTLQAGVPVFLRLLDRMDMSFTYHLKSDKTIKQSTETVAIDAIVEVPEQWSKTIAIVPPTQESGDFTVAFPLDPGQFTQIASLVQEEAGLLPARYDLSITARVSVNAETDYGTIRKDFVHSISTTLSEGMIDWGETTAQSTPGSIAVTESARNPSKFLLMPLTTARYLVPIVAGILIIVFTYLAILYFRKRPGKPTEIDLEAQQAKKKYKAMIAELKDLPGVEPNETVISLHSLDDLIKTAEGLLKPVLHKAETYRHTYLVFDGPVRYMYINQLDNPDSRNKKTEPQDRN